MRVKKTENMSEETFITSIKTHEHFSSSHWVFILNMLTGPNTNRKSDVSSLCGNTYVTDVIVDKTVNVCSDHIIQDY